MDARGPIIAFMVCEVLLLLAPQFFFAGSLVKARFSALAGYSLAAFEMTREFNAQWIGPEARRDAKLLDSPQSSAMIDFASTYGIVKAMRPVAISLREVFAILLPVAAPFAPLLLYQYSITEILRDGAEAGAVSRARPVPRSARGCRDAKTPPEP